MNVEKLLVIVNNAVQLYNSLIHSVIILLRYKIDI